GTAAVETAAKPIAPCPGRADGASGARLRAPGHSHRPRRAAAGPGLVAERTIGAAAGYRRFRAKDGRSQRAGRCRAKRVLSAAPFQRPGRAAIGGRGLVVRLAKPLLVGGALVGS